MNAKKDLDKRMEALVDRLEDELVDEDGEPLPHDHVAEVVASTAAHFVDVPVKDFVPLLVEHEVRDELAHEGVHRQLPDDIGVVTHPASSDAE